MEKDLVNIRQEIADIDEKIIKLIERRIDCVVNVAEYKKNNSLPIFHEDIEKQKIDKARKMLSTQYSEDVIYIYDQIMKKSKDIQSRYIINGSIMLVGFMGTGKTSVSKVLGKMLSIPVIEMDEYIAKKEGKTVSEIFSLYGEEYFRNLESNLIISLKNKNTCVVSCGGGAILRKQNVDNMRVSGTIVLLRARADTIYDRLKDTNDRPLLFGNMNVDYISKLMETRRERYESCADIVIDTDDKSIDKVCNEIISECWKREKNAK